ncbi:MAG: YtxH domain-containing protein [Patescibacteria group bacterium]
MKKRHANARAKQMPSVMSAWLNNMATKPAKKTSRFGSGIAIGSILGIAAGLFLKSKKGKQLSADAMKKAQALQKQVMKKLDESDVLTKAQYEKVVDEVMSYYLKGKEIAKNEVPEVRKYLLNRWKAIEGYTKEDDEA